ncbi:hypothetical protein S7335_2842 [Synechococcus sp. PCC 7335]|nr:hypothetical protein S7335_2842 [Synechococcus sp. PCC 7335]
MGTTAKIAVRQVNLKYANTVFVRRSQPPPETVPSNYV